MANEKQLVIEVRDKIATLKSKNFNLVGGNSDYDVVFDFDKDWDKDNVKTAIFVFGREKPVYKVFNGNVCEGIAINNATTCLIGVVAGDVRTTTSAVVDCVYRSIVDEAGETPEPPTEDVYNQIMELLNKYIQQGGGGGSVSEEDIIRVIEKYLEEHPVKDGFSPTVSVEDIGNGHRVVITDKNGEHSFDLFNGANGLTPYIKDGNWWIGEEDTGILASSGVVKKEIYDIDITLNILDDATGRFSIEMSNTLYKDLKLRIYYMYQWTDESWAENDDRSYTVPAGEGYVDYVFESEGTIIGTPYITFYTEQYDPHIQVIDEHHLRYYEERTIVDASAIMVGGEPVALERDLNEVESIAKGAQKAVSYDNYKDFIRKLNYLDTGDQQNKTYHVGQSIMIVTLNVPDLWVSKYATYHNYYQYTTDEAFVEELMANGKVHIGYYEVSALETQKVNLADYYDKGEIDGMIGDISTALDTLHEYAQSLVSGGEGE